MSGCGCNNTSGESGESSDLLLVNATSKHASTCGTPDDIQVGGADCQKDDSFYDLLLADFAFPSDASVNVLVCDGSIYTVGMWIHFVNANASVQILSITDNQLTVSAVCTNGAEVYGNPTAGTIIRQNDAIISREAPDCLTDSQRASRIIDDLAAATEFCLPALAAESSTTAEMQVVGFKRADAADSSFQKCIKRIASFFFKGGDPYLEDLDLIELADAANYRDVKIHKTSHKVVEQKALSEESGLVAGKKYNYGVVNGAESLVEGYNFTYINEVLLSHGGDIDDQSTWVNLPNGTPGYSTTLSLNIAAVNSLNILPETFYAEVHIVFGAINNAVYKVISQLLLNSITYGAISTNYTNAGFVCMSVKIPVTKTAKTIDLEINSDTNIGTAKFHLTARLIGVHI